MRKRMVWILGFGLGLVAVVAIVALRSEAERVDTSEAVPAQSTESEAAPAQSGEPAEGSLTDGLGEELVAMGEAPGGQWYCEPDGLVRSALSEIIYDGVDEGATVRDLINWAVGGSVLANRVDEIVGPVTLAYSDDFEPVTESTEGIVDQRRSDVLARFPEAESREMQLLIAIEDPRRSENTTAGLVELTFDSVEGWQAEGFSMCDSALNGFYERHEPPLSEEERRKLDPIDDPVAQATEPLVVHGTAAGDSWYCEANSPIEIGTFTYAAGIVEISPREQLDRVLSSTTWAKDVDAHIGDVEVTQVSLAEGASNQSKQRVAVDSPLGLGRAETLSVIPEANTADALELSLALLDPTRSTNEAAGSALFRFKADVGWLLVSIATCPSAISSQTYIDSGHSQVTVDPGDSQDSEERQRELDKADLENEGDS